MSKFQSMYYRDILVFVFTFLEGCSYTARTYELLFPIVAIEFAMKIVNSSVLFIKVMCCCYHTQLLLCFNLITILGLECDNNK